MEKEKLRQGSACTSVFKGEDTAERRERFNKLWIRLLRTAGMDLEASDLAEEERPDTSAVRKP